MRKYTVSEVELRRADVLSQLRDGRLSIDEVSGILNISRRQVYRLRAKFDSLGTLGLVHKSRGRTSPRKFSNFQTTKILNIVKTHYSDFGPTLAAEKLQERHSIQISREALRKIMMEAGIWKARKARKRFHQPRERREYYGELVQIDGSHHRWFEDRGDKCTLLVCVDDATSALMALKFVASESTANYFAILGDYLQAHGRPVAFYSDKHSVFRVNAKNAKGGNGMTQFGRALMELTIDGICAETAPAKGRVERANRTLQDRLVKELRLEGISTIEEANAFVPKFIQKYNARFAKPPYRSENRHRAYEQHAHPLDDILCIREKRCVSHQLTFMYQRKKYMLKVTDDTSGLSGKYVDLYDRAGHPLIVRHGNTELEYTVFDKNQRIAPGAIVANKSLSAVLAYAQKMHADLEAERPKLKTNSERIHYEPRGNKVGRTSKFYRNSKKSIAAE